MKTVFRWIVRIAAALGLLLVIVSATPVLRWWTDALSTDWGREEGDVLIVLGGDDAGNNVIGLSSYWRSYYTVLEWREHHCRSILITGKDIAPIMRDFLVSQGVPASIVHVENAASSTRQSALFIAPMLRSEPGRRLLLTSDFHMGRALSTFRKAGIDASPVPIPDARKRVSDPAQCWALFIALAQETVKSAYYKSRGWL